MTRAIVAVLCLLAAVLWLPVWVQFILFVFGIAVVQYRLMLLVPAIVADVIYAPRPSLLHMNMTLIVGGMLIIWYLLMTQTRLGESHYVSIKK